MIGTIYFEYSPFSEVTIYAEKSAIDKEKVMDYIFEMPDKEITEFREEKISDSTYAYYLTYIDNKPPVAHHYFSKAPYREAYREIVEYNKAKYRKEFTPE